VIESLWMGEYVCVDVSASEWLCVCELVGVKRTNK
jgi:hypothetical protein